MKKYFIVGSCRVKRFRAYLTPEERKNIEICPHHLHNPFEIQQIIGWLSGSYSISDIQIEETSPYHNEIFTRKQRLPKNYYKNLQEKYAEADCLVIEVSSTKRLTIDIGRQVFDCNLTSVSYLKKNNLALVNMLTETNPCVEEFFGALRNIRTLTADKQLFVVPHFSWSVDSSPLRSRQILRDRVLESCKTLDITVLDPDICLARYPRSLMVIDSSHYTHKFERLIAKYYIKSLFDPK